MGTLLSPQAFSKVLMRTVRPGPACSVWLYAACLALVVASFAFFGFTLDRYPLPYVDEPLFNYPAINYLEGRGFHYAMSSAAPHAETLWAYHGPFYPRLQILTFSLLGVSEMACRLPQFLGAHLAILVLSMGLVRLGLAPSGLLLAVIWIGDRSNQEVLYGRMEGINLLLLALGFLSLVGTVARPSFGRGAAVGVCLTTAVGFHPVTALFPLVSFPVLGLLLPPTRRLRPLLGMVVGGLIPAVLLLWSWSPRIVESWEQFQWHRSEVIQTLTWRDQIPNLLRVLGWSRYWFVALTLASVLLLVSVASRFLVPERARALRKPREAVWIVASVFSVLGLGCIAGASVFPYYLVYFTVWPVIGLAVLWETRSFPRAVFPLLLLALVAASWVPSLLWNAFRAREAVLYYRDLDPAPIARRLAQAIPAGDRVTGTPELFLIARKADLVFTPLPWLSEETEVPADHWILLTRSEWLGNERISCADKASRPVFLQESAFPNARKLDYPLVLLGPRMKGAR